ncbi:MAG: DUF5367 family protein [Eudoraea sp.]|nr:DUF5367 family protein [Eudoraea sp.]
MHYKSVIISAIIVWTIAVLAFVGSYFVPVMEDPDLQANWVLSIALIPAALIGAHIYYRKGHQTNGLKLGLAMFGVAILMDAIITVHFLIMPYGGNYISFFTDPGFWLIGVEYVTVVAAYWQIEKAVGVVREVSRDGAKVTQRRKRFKSSVRSETATKERLSQNLNNLLN